MSKESVSRLQRALEALDALLSEDRESVIELVRHRLREQRRVEITRNGSRDAPDR